MSAEVFSFTAEHPSDTHCVINLTGEIDMLTAPEMRDGILAQLAGQPQHLVLDLGNVTFFGSRGIAVLAEVKGIADDQGTKVYLTGADHRLVARPLYLTGIAGIFNDNPPLPDPGLA